MAGWFSRVKKVEEPSPAHIRQYDPASFEALIRGRGGVVSPIDAVRVSAVLCCIDTITSAISSLPPHIRDVATGERVDDAAVMAQLRRPNENQSYSDFVRWYLWQCLLHGNALALIQGDQLIPIPWGSVAMQTEPTTRRLRYSITGGDGINDHVKVYPSDFCMHMRDITDDGLVGKSRVARSGDSVMHSLNLIDASNAMFANGAMPSGSITFTGRLTPEQRDVLRKELQSLYGGSSNAGKILLLDNEAAWRQMSTTGRDAELVESRKFAVIDICRLFQVPPPLVMAYENNTFTNASTASKWFSTFCLRYWVSKLEETYTHWILPDGMELEIDMSTFTRSDLTERWNAYKIAIETGVLTVEEVRNLEGY